MKYSRFEDTPVWQAAIELAHRVFDLLEDRLFDGTGDLRNQLQRAALSISNNIAEGFERWERHEEWGDVSFMIGQGQHIEKMAIVGDEKWRDDALAFTAKGFRPTAIEFFGASRLNEARAWLSS